MNSNHPAKIDMVSHHYRPVPILTVHEARCEAKKRKVSDVHHASTKDVALYLMPTKSKPEHITAACQVVQKAWYEKTVLISTRAAGQIEVFPHNNISESYACIMGNRIMGVYTGRPFYITITNFGKVDVQLPSPQKFGEVANVPV